MPSPVHARQCHDATLLQTPALCLPFPAHTAAIAGKKFQQHKGVSPEAQLQVHESLQQPQKDVAWKKRRKGRHTMRGRRGIQAVTNELVSRGDSGKSECQLVGVKPGSFRKTQSWYTRRRFLSSSCAATETSRWEHTMRLIADACLHIADVASASILLWHTMTSCQRTSFTGECCVEQTCED